jgi:hypothetical protein
MFSIDTSRDFLAKLEADFTDYAKEPGSGRLALNCAMTACHLHEWVWGDWLKTDYTVWKTLGIRDLETFLAWIDRTCPWFQVIQGLTNGAKHFVRNQPVQALRVGAPPFMLDTPGAGFDEGHLDGPMPYVSGGKEFLLFDFGPEAAEHRWMPAATLLERVVRFWREFFEKYAPPPHSETSTNRAEPL